MNEAVLDSSAVLAVLNGEPGSEQLSPGLLSNSVCSTVNLAEVQAKLVAKGLSAQDAWTATLSAIGEVAGFTAEHARVAASLIAQTTVLGLSLGDRACLALALTLRLPVYTADRSWKKLRLHIPIHIIR